MASTSGLYVQRERERQRETERDRDRDRERERETERQRETERHKNVCSVDECNNRHELQHIFFKPPLTDFS